MSVSISHFRPELVIYSYASIFTCYNIAMFSSRMLITSLFAMFLSACFIPSAQELTSITAPKNGGGSSSPKNNKYIIYGSNNGSGSISVVEFDKDTNKLSLLETKTDAPSSPEKMEIKGDNLYVAGNWVDKKITHYKINSSSGKLTKILDYTDPADPRNVVIKGDYLYAVNFLSPGKISKYKINADGSLADFVNYNTAANKPRSLSAHPTLDVLYTAGLWNWNVYEQSLNSATGALTETNNIGTQNDPSCIEISPDGKYAFSCNWGAHTITSYSVNQTTGALSLIGHYPSVSNNPYTLETNTDASCIYLSNTGGEKIEIFSSVAGVPTHVSSIDYTGGAAGGIKFMDDYLFVSHLDGHIRVHTVNNDCSLTELDDLSAGGSNTFDVFVYKVP